MNYLAMFDSDWVRCCDLDGKPLLVTITKCEPGEIRNVSKKSRKPILHFKEFPKPLALNKTNGKAIAALFSPETEQWKGKQIVLYPARTTFGSEEVDCIRVRGPNGKAAAPPPSEPPPAEDEAGAPTMADLTAAFLALNWDPQRRDQWAKEKFGRLVRGLDGEMLSKALEMLQGKAVSA